MAMNYTQLTTYLETILVDQAPSTDFTTILPAAIQYAEGRIYREMDFVATRTIQSPTAFTANSRDFTLPTSNNTILVLQGVSAISPAGQIPPAGVQNPLMEVSLDYIDMTWPNESSTGLPTVFAVKNDTQIVVAPTPDAAYQAKLTGTFQPAAMSASNATTYIGDIYPDLLVAACMIFMAGYQRDYGAQSDDPKLAQSWEEQYQTLLKSAISEEQRRKGQGTGWAPFSETPLATPPRT
jgi:hypothetical protein